jgi:hypothetical protein
VRQLDEQYAVDVPADEILRGVGQLMSQFVRVTVSSAAPGQVIVRETWRPVWTMVVAVILFPFGLIALLSTRQATLVLNAVTLGDETHVDITGWAHDWVCNPILRLFADSSDEEPAESGRVG